MKPFIILLPVLSFLGCTNACPNGPACENNWPAAELAIHQWTAGNESVDVRTNATTIVVGEENEGSDWRAVGSNGQLWIGMPEINTVKQVDSGALNTESTRGSWSTTAGRFGAQLAVIDQENLDLQTLLITAPEWSLQRGALAFFELEKQNTDYTLKDAKLIITGGSAGDHLGSQLAVCGDLSGDGLPEIAISIPWLNESPEGEHSTTIEPLAGAVALLLSELLEDATGEVPWYELGPTWWGTSEGDSLGYAIDCSADLNDDGLADILLGAPFVGDDNRGLVYGIFGGTQLEDGPIADVRDLEISGTGSDSWAGSSIATAALNDNETTGVLIGEPGYNQGRGRVFMTTTDLINESPYSPKYVSILRGSEEAGGAMHFGRYLHTGDIDGDTLADILVSAPDFRYENRSDAGRTWIYLGSTSSTWSVNLAAEQTASGTIIGSQSFQRTGRNLSLAGLNENGSQAILMPIRAASP